MESNAGLRTDLGSLRQASYFAALIEQTTEAEAPLPALFARDFVRLLRQLQNQPPNPQTVFGFEMKLLEDLGLNPNHGPGAVNTPEAGRYWKNCWQWIGRRYANCVQARRRKPKSANFSHGFLIYHIRKDPEGRNRLSGTGV